MPIQNVVAPAARGLSALLDPTFLLYAVPVALTLLILVGLILSRDRDDDHDLPTSDHGGASGAGAAPRTHEDGSET